MLRKLFYIILFLAMVINTLSFAQENLNIRKVSSLYDFWDCSHSLVLEGDYAYIATRLTGLQIVDISDPEEPVVVGSYSDRSRYWDVKVIGDYAYVGAYEVVKIFDISNKTNPSWVSDLAFRNCPVSYAVGSGYAYLTGSHEDEEGDEIELIMSMYGYDISSLEHPRRVYSVVSEGGGPYCAYRNIEINGDYLFLPYCYHGGLQICNLTNPPELPTISDFGRGIRFYSYAIQDAHIYLSTSNDELFVYDISEPENPDQVGNLDLPENSAGYLSVSENIVGIASDSVLSIIDVSDPESPELESQSDLRICPTDIDVSGNLVGLTNISPGLQLVDVTDPSEPDIIGSYCGSGRALDITVSGELVYLAAGVAGLKVIDISDLEAPDEVACFDDISGANAITVSDGKAYIADGDSNLSVIDIRDPDNLSLLAQIETPGIVNKTAVAGDFVFVIDLPNTLHIYDLSDIDNPQQIGYLTDERFNGMTCITISGDYAYVGSRERFNIVNISNPENPRLVREQAVRGVASDIEIVDDIVFVADGQTTNEYEPGLWIFNISNPINPRFINCYTYNSFRSIVNIEIAEDFVFIVGEDCGLRILNISNPRHPFETGYYQILASPQSVAVSNGYAITANLWNIGIYDCSEALSVKDSKAQCPVHFSLLSVYPNPFNSSTTISYELPLVSLLDLSLYDLSGHKVMTLINGVQPSGNHSSILDANILSSGMYIIRLEAAGDVQVQKILLIR
ncbi:MAG: T9SS type A sorting domain-containing protein [Candidatus Hatepunaea meridiana]|nr:T9SS type A sorting domain-containing protein [Candidatus Hatepunaea meridiana]